MDSAIALTRYEYSKNNRDLEKIIAYNNGDTVFINTFKKISDSSKISFLNSYYSGSEHLEYIDSIVKKKDTLLIYRNSFDGDGVYVHKYTFTYIFKKDSIREFYQNFYSNYSHKTINYYEKNLLSSKVFDDSNRYSYVCKQISENVYERNLDYNFREITLVDKNNNITQIDIFVNNKKAIRIEYEYDSKDSILKSQKTTFYIAIDAHSYFFGRYNVYNPLIPLMGIKNKKEYGYYVYQNLIRG
ncbi:MAG: hypothetical protein U0V72_12605 [Cytophagales bacterium]